MMNRGLRREGKQEAYEEIKSEGSRHRKGTSTKNKRGLASMARAPLNWHYGAEGVANHGLQIC